MSTEGFQIQLLKLEYHTIAFITATSRAKTVSLEPRSEIRRTNTRNIGLKHTICCQMDVQ